MKSVVCIALARNDLFSGFLINSRPTSGLRLRLASSPLGTVSTRLDVRLSIAVRSASDGSAVIIILLFALRLRCDVVDAYFVARYL